MSLCSGTYVKDFDNTWYYTNDIIIIIQFLLILKYQVNSTKKHWSIIFHIGHLCYYNSTFLFYRFILSIYFYYIDNNDRGNRLDDSYDKKKERKINEEKNFVILCIKIVWIFRIRQEITKVSDNSIRVMRRMGNGVSHVWR